MSIASTVSPAEAVVAYERWNRNLTATATALGVSTATVRARLRAYHGSAEKVPKPPLRSSSAAIGRKFEHRVRDALTSAGWWVVRAAGSKGEADLVALQAGAIVLVNVKRGGQVLPAEWNTLLRLADRVWGVAVVASMRKGGGIDWHQILAPKDGSKRRQPWTEWTP